MAAAAALAVQKVMKRDNLLAAVRRLGAHLERRLAEVLGGHPHVGDIRGLGMMWGVEIVRDRNTLQPFPRKQKVTEALWQNLFDRGVITYKSVGMAGTDGDGLIVAPPFVITAEEIDLVVEQLRQAIAQVLG